MAKCDYPGCTHRDEIESVLEVGIRGRRAQYDLCKVHRFEWYAFRQEFRDADEHERRIIIAEARVMARREPDSGAWEDVSAPGELEDYLRRFVKRKPETAREIHSRQVGATQRLADKYQQWLREMVELEEKIKEMRER
jgi:hypothetical protein